MERVNRLFNTKHKIHYVEDDLKKNFSISRGEKID